MNDPAAQVNHDSQVHDLKLVKSFLGGTGTPPKFICSLSLGPHHGSVGHGPTKKFAYREACSKLLDEIKKGPVDSIKEVLNKKLKKHLSNSQGEIWRYKKYVKDYCDKVEKYVRKAERLTYPFSK